MTSVRFVALALSFVLVWQSASAQVQRPLLCEPQFVELGDSQFKVAVQIYPAKNRLQKSLILFPPTGGVNYLDRSYAYNFCKAGYDIFLLQNWTGDQEFSLDLDIHQRLYERAQKAVSITLNSIESPFIGVLGTSVGGIHAAISMGLQDRLDAAFLITAGLPIAEVIASSDQEVLVQAKESRREIHKFKSDQEYAELLQARILYEPTKLPARFKGKALGLIIATRDKTVPYVNQIALKNFWQPQVVLELGSNHFIGIIRSWLFYQDEMIRFFDRAAEQKLQKP